MKLFEFLFEKIVPMRTLYSRDELGVTQIEGVRQNVHSKFKNPEDIESYKKKFIESFPELLLDEKRNYLKEYIMLVDKSPEDLKTLKSILLQYQDSYNHSVHSVKEFCFGTQIMRIFYLLNLPDDAVQFFKDKEMKSLFHQMQTYKVILALLYENKRYAEVFELYQEIRKHLELYELFPDQTINCLAFAACYHLVNNFIHFNEKSQ